MPTSPVHPLRDGCSVGRPVWPPWTTRARSPRPSAGGLPKRWSTPSPCSTRSTPMTSAWVTWGDPLVTCRARLGVEQPSIRDVPDLTPDLECFGRELRGVATDEEIGRIVHGDFRIGNTIVSSDGCVRGVLDWEELSTIGYQSWISGGCSSTGWSPARTADSYRRCRARREDFSRGVRSRIATPRRRDGILARLGDYVALAAWKVACITVGVYQRHHRGAGPASTPPGSGRSPTTSTSFWPSAPPRDAASSEARRRMERDATVSLTSRVVPFAAEMLARYRQDGMLARTPSARSSTRLRSECREISQLSPKTIGSRTAASTSRARVSRTVCSRPVSSQVIGSPSRSGTRSRPSWPTTGYSKREWFRFVRSPSTATAR